MRKKKRRRNNCGILGLFDHTVILSQHIILCFRKEKNRIHAKKTRLRKKMALEEAGKVSCVNYIVSFVFVMILI